MDDTALQDLRDREEIRDLLARYCEKVDEYAIDEMVEVFTEDVVTDYGPTRGGPVTGREVLRERVAKGQAIWRRTHHQLGQSRITVDGDTAHSSTYNTAWHQRFDGTVETVRLRYVDDLVRTPDGWRIARRELWVDGVEGFEGQEWQWVPRPVPQP